MITASCRFCEEIRQEASGQQTVVGLFEHSEPEVRVSHLTRLAALISIHVTPEDKDVPIAIRLSIDGEAVATIVPPAELVAKTLKNAKIFGSNCAPLFSDLIIVDRPVEVGDGLTVDISLVAADVETLIGTFTALPPEAD